jgi:hypothetical protein
LNFFLRQLIKERQSDDSISHEFRVGQSKLRCAAPRRSDEHWLQVQRRKISAGGNSFSQHRSTDRVTVSAGEFFC